MLMVVPNPTTPNWATTYWVTTYSVAPFFSDRAYRGCLAPGENVLPLPVQSGGDSMLWQVESDFRFRMAGGRVATTPPSPFMNPRVDRAGRRRLPDHGRRGRSAQGPHRGEGRHKRRRRQAPGRRSGRPALDAFAKRQDVGGVLLYRVAGPPDHV